MTAAPHIASAALLALGACSATPSQVSSIAALSSADCGPQVSRAGDRILVAPSGGDDTAALQCALDEAIADGAPITVSLGAGTFITRPVYAKGFSGRLSGAGAGTTILTNPDDAIPVTPVDMYAAEPSAGNPWPTLVSFIGGDFEVSDLTVAIRGEAPTTGWSIFGIEPPIRAFAHAFVVVGAVAYATFARIEVLGAPAPQDFAGMNLINAMYYEGLVGLDPYPISGSLSVRDSHFDGVGSAVPIANVRDATVRIENNRIRTALVGIEITDLERVDYQATGNHIETAYAGVDAYDNCLGPSAVCGTSASRLLLAGNEVKAEIGFHFALGMGDEMRCSIVGNRVEADDVGVHLGRRTHDCLVAASGTVRDLGTHNRVVGP